MKALIAGAGISGLATGIALRQAGFDVEIFERSPALREIGAGLMIWRWSGGRAVLVGDAAHPMTPNAGQGACQALADAAVLGDSLRRAPDLAAGFAMYERRRMRRANRVVAMARQGTRSVQFENPIPVRSARRPWNTGRPPAPGQNARRSAVSRTLIDLPAGA